MNCLQTINARRICCNFLFSANFRVLHAGRHLIDYFLLFSHVIQIRDFEYSTEAQESRKQELEKLMQDQESLRSSLLQWCYTSYGEVFVLSIFEMLIYPTM
jgi:hypothetical protein